jgi:hypothetical protein
MQNHGRWTTSGVLVAAPSSLEPPQPIVDNARDYLLTTRRRKRRYCKREDAGSREPANADAASKTTGAASLLGLRDVFPAACACPSFSAQKIYRGPGLPDHVCAGWLGWCGSGKRAMRANGWCKYDKPSNRWVADSFLSGRVRR